MDDDFPANNDDDAAVVALFRFVESNSKQFRDEFCFAEPVVEDAGGAGGFVNLLRFFPNFFLEVVAVVVVSCVVVVVVVCDGAPTGGTTREALAELLILQCVCVCMCVTQSSTCVCVCVNVQPRDEPAKQGRLELLFRSPGRDST